MNTTSSRSKIRKGRLFWLSLRVAFGRFPLWASMTLLMCIAGLVIAFPWHAWFSGLDGHRFQVGEEIASLSEVFRNDHRAELSQLNQATSSAGAILVFLVWLAGVFAAGGWVQVILERSHSQTVRRFCVGGARHFLRFLRLALLLLLVLGAIRWILYGLPFDKIVLQQMFGLPKSDLAAATRMESLDSETARDQILWIRDGIMAILFVLVMAWGIYTRARIAVSGSRSVLLASGLTFMSMIRYPVRTVGPLLALLVTEALLLLAVLGPLSNWLNGQVGESTGSTTIWLLFAIGLIALAWREIHRGARYHAAIVVSKATIRSSHHVDPWQTIGAPGGPQYPVNEEGEDRFGVSV